MHEGFKRLSLLEAKQFAGVYGSTKFVVAEHSKRMDVGQYEEKHGPRRSVKLRWSKILFE